MFNQGVVLGKLGRSEEVLQVYKQVDERYGKDTDPSVREQVASALVNQGAVFGKLGRSEEEIGIYEMVNERYGEETDPGVREEVAKALLNHGVVLGELGHSEEAIIALRKAEVIFVALGMIRRRAKGQKIN